MNCCAFSRRRKDISNSQRRQRKCREKDGYKVSLIILFDAGGHRPKGAHIGRGWFIDPKESSVLGGPVTAGFHELMRVIGRGAGVNRQRVYLSRGFIG